MKIRFFATAALFALTVFAGVRAADPTMLVVEKTDGSVASYALPDSPKLTFPQGIMTVTTADATVDFPLTEIRNYRFATPGEGSAAVLAPDETRFVVVGPGIIDILTSGRVPPVSVADMQGRRVNPRVMVSGAGARVDMTSLSPGVYILSAGADAMKILVR